MLDFSNIGRALRKLRQSRKLKQSEVAKAAGITSPMLSAYETGKQRPSFSTIDKILDALEFTADDLTHGMQEEQPDGPDGITTSELLGRMTDLEMSEEESELFHRFLPALVAVVRHTRGE